jgi:hypothetical protein
MARGYLSPRPEAAERKDSFRYAQRCRNYSSLNDRRLPENRSEANMTKIVPIHDPSISAPDVADALDAEIDAMWGLIAALQTISTEHSGDPYIKGALRLANSHLDALATIRRDVDRL